MKKLLLILAVWLSVPAYAQKIHFTDTSNLWLVYDTYNGPPPDIFLHGVRYRDNADTIIHSISYKILFSTTPSPWSSYPCSTMIPSECYGFVREDTSLNKVFVLINDTEQVLMDYNLQIGDSAVHKDLLHIVSIDTVFGVDSVIINSVFHKVWYFHHVYSPPGTYSYPQYSVVEGIGCLFGPLFMSSPAFGLNEYNLICFNNNGTSPLVSPAVPEWYGGVNFDNHMSCTLGLNQTTKAKQENDIYPNPAPKSITITSSKKITSITITNLLGQTIYIHDRNSEKVEVDVSHLPPGIYIVKINGSEMRRFVKN